MSSVIEPIIENAPNRSPIILTEDEEIQSVRPKSITEFIGQRDTIDNLYTFLKAARIRQTALDHTLVAGPAGLGKTTIAQIIANEMGSQIKTIIGPAIQKVAEIASILMSMQNGDVLFIDEIHRIPVSVSEMLYGAVEDFVLDIVIGEGQNTRVVKIDLPRFTLVGATTRSGSLPTPLLSRFGIHLSLELYDHDDLAMIVKRSAAMMNIAISDDGAYQIACRSRGTPRIANRLLRRVHDFALVQNKRIIDYEIADLALTRLGVDRNGLDQLDRRYLNWIVTHHNGGPVGVETLAAGLQETRETIEDRIEPYLIQAGYITRTPRGRMVKKDIIM